MKKTVRQIIDIIESKIAPPELACSWDSPGLKTGSLKAEVSKVLVCLDLTSAAVEEAGAKSCEMIVTHHPAIFHAVTELTEDNHSALCAAVRNGIAVYSAHTNFDFADDGMNDALAAKIGLTRVQKDTSGTHRFGSLPQPETLEQFAARVKQILGIPYLSVIDPQCVKKAVPIERVGVSCGAFDGETEWIYEEGLDVLLTGEIKHSDAVALSEASFRTVGAGHYFTEHCGVAHLAERFNALQIPAVLAASSASPFIFY